MKEEEKEKVLLCIGGKNRVSWCIRKLSRVAAYWVSFSTIWDMQSYAFLRNPFEAAMAMQPLKKL